MRNGSLRLIVRILTAIIALYVAWLGMLVVHELGHIVGALLSGGRPISLSIPAFGFSQTIVHPNPHELAVVWCGPVIGTIIPLLVLLIVRALRRRVPDSLKFFAGFCAVANGAYIGLGWIWHAGDAGDMLRLGTPVACMIAFGLVFVVLGLMCWHRTQSLSLRGKSSVNDSV